MRYLLTPLTRLLLAGVLLLLTWLLLPATLLLLARLLPGFLGLLVRVLILIAHSQFSLLYSHSLGQRRSRRIGCEGTVLP
jgi:hypothetical protein